MDKMKHFTFRKRLLALAVCAFAWIGANAWDYGYDEDGTTPITLLVYPEDIANNFNNHMFGDMPSTVTTVKLVGTFPNGWSSGWLQDGTTSGKGNITLIDLSGADLSATTATGPDSNSGDVSCTNATWSFCSFLNEDLTITWPTAGNITVIPKYAFKNTALQTVHIPGYIQYICTQAFDSSSSDPYLKSIIFDEYKDSQGTSLVNMQIGR